MHTLVLAASGHIGPSAVAALLADGNTVTAVVRDAARAGSVLPKEAHLAVGDFTHRSWLQGQLDEVDSLVLLTPHGPDMARTQLAIVEDAIGRGIRIVKVSGTGSLIAEDGPDACRQHWLVEQAMAGMARPHVVLRPNAFMQGLVAGLVAEARATGRISDPLSGSAINAVDCRDIGEVIARAVADQGLDGRTLMLTGPRSLTYRDLARVIDDAGVPAEVRTGSPEETADRVRALGMSEWEADHLREMLGHFGAGAADFVTPTVKEVLGRDPCSVETFITELTAPTPA